jgi:cell division protein ZipA
MDLSWNPAIGIPLALLGAAVLFLVYWLGRPKKPGQGRRTEQRTSPDPAGPRREPRIEGAADEDIDEAALQSELQLLERAMGRPEPAAGHARAGEAPAGARKPAAAPPRDFQRIVTLFVAARAGHVFHGDDIAVAAEKVGLDFGSMNIFHRLVDGKPEAGPVFSVANMVKPGSFDMAAIDEIETPGLSFFMTLPGPVPALDGWDMMLPAAQRMAELLDGLVLDEDRNSLSRPRIQQLRDELRAFDRSHERDALKRGW